MALIQRTGAANFPNQLKALVSGHPKSGKTTLLGTIPNIVIADTEPHANNLASLAHLDVPYVTINSTVDLQELLMVLASPDLRAKAAESLGLPSIDAVAIDTLDTLQKIMKKERLASTRAKWDRDDWGWLKDEMIKIIEAFTALPLHVVFCVHLKTQEMGKGDNKYTVTLPGLEGGIAGEIAGMVGYSLLSFRREEPGPQGTPITKYWLRAEGDETYDFLGTRTAGRLPTIIEPDFKTVYDAAMAGRPTQAAPEPVQTPVATQQQAPQQQQAPAESGPNPGPDQGQPAMAVENPPQQPAQSEQAARAADTEPVNDIALQHVKKVYDALSMPFPEAKLRERTLGEARQVVMFWKAIQQDHAQGKAQEGSTPEGDMVEYLQSVNLMPDEGTAAPEQKQVEPKVDGNIDEVKAYVNKGADEVEVLKRANEAFEIERTGKNRKTLMDWLESKGARHGGDAPSGEPTPQPQENVQTDVQNQPEAPAESPTEGVTPQASQADESATEEEAIQAASEGLGADVVAIDINADAKCEVCGGPIDDPDIARLAKTRYGKVACVDDYIKLNPNR